MLASAVTAARKAHLPEIVGQLRSALLLYHPNAAGECKAAAIKVLEAHDPGFEASPEDEDDQQDDDPTEKEVDQEQVPSVLCAEAALLRSSLDGSDDASRTEWVDAVKSCKTLSRLASLTTAFAHDAMDKLKRINIEKDALISAIDMWKREERKNRPDESNEHASCTNEL